MTSTQLTKFRKWITFFALLIAIAHIVFPKLGVDAVTLVLLGFAILPWLAPIFKSLEFPGGFKVEFPDLQRIATDADQAGLLAQPTTTDESSKHTFELVAEADPNLALAGLRIEIEKRLRLLAERNDVPVKARGLGGVYRALRSKDILTTEEESVLADLTGLLNQAVHGADVTSNAAEWAIDIGPRLLAGLDEKIAASS